MIDIFLSYIKQEATDMKRAAMERREKDLLSKITKNLNYSEYIHANLFTMERVRGLKPLSNIILVFYLELIYI